MQPKLELRGCVRPETQADGDQDGDGEFSLLSETLILEVAAINLRAWLPPEASRRIPRRTSTRGQGRCL